MANRHTRVLLQFASTTHHLANVDINLIWKPGNSGIHLTAPSLCQADAEQLHAFASLNRNRGVRSVRKHRRPERLASEDTGFGVSQPVQKKQATKATIPPVTVHGTLFAPSCLSVCARACASTESNIEGLACLWFHFSTILPGLGHSLLYGLFPSVS